jgi:hypothetical protein
MVMYQLVTLDEPYEVSRMVDRMNERRLRTQNGRVLRSLTILQSSNYGEDLFELILDCLKMVPEERPTPEKALDTINGWLQDYHECIQMDLTIQDGPKVFYKANDINYMTPGGYDFDLSDKWWRGYFNRNEAWLDERWGRLKPPNRPEQLDPWPKEKHNRDEVMVPDSALERENQRVKRRKTDADRDIVFDTEIEETDVSPQTSIQNRDTKLFVFPDGFENVQEPYPLATPQPPEIVNPPRPGLRHKFRNFLSPSRGAAGPDQSAFPEAFQIQQQTQNAGQQQQGWTLGPYRSPVQMQQNQPQAPNMRRQRDENGLGRPWESA